MRVNIAGGLLLISTAAAILPPGYPAYIGAYVALAAALLALVLYGWSQRAAFSHPTAVAAMAAIALLAGVIPFVYRGPQDLMAPVLVLPMLATVGLGLLASPATGFPSATLFAVICLMASMASLAGGLYEHYVLGIYRPGLGNNPIHYSSLTAFSGSLALVGVVAVEKPWRYVFLLGPIFAIGVGIVADSRGPLLGATAMSGIGLMTLAIWLRREKLFRYAFAATVLITLGVAAYLIASGNSRIAGIFDSALNIFRFTGGDDDIRAALYASAIEVLRTSPIVGVGLGQIMLTAQTKFPIHAEIFLLEHLHADWANFAAMAGAIGLTVWLLLLAAPLLLLWNARVRRDKVIVLAAILLTTGQLALGISNATFGILPQTTIYAVSLGYFLARARRLAMDDQPAE